MDVKLRMEEEKDHNIVENITREAFWNLYKPGCDEHFLLHNIRNANEFIKELDYVAIYNNEIVGNIVCAKSKIITVLKEYDVLTFGPLSVLPKYQSKGIGGKLINHTVKLSKEMGFKAIGRRLGRNVMCNGAKMAIFMSFPLDYYSYFYPEIFHQNAGSKQHNENANKTYYGQWR